MYTMTSTYVCMNIISRNNATAMTATVVEILMKWANVPLWLD